MVVLTVVPQETAPGCTLMQCMLLHKDGYVVLGLLPCTEALVVASKRCSLSFSFFVTWCAILPVVLLCSGRACTRCQVWWSRTMVAQQVQQQEDKEVYALLHISTSRCPMTTAATVSLFHQKVGGPVMALCLHDKRDK